MDTDRRAYPRMHVTLPCKIYQPGRGRYVAGTTSDLSAWGAVICLAESTHVQPGERVVVGVATTESPGLVRRERMRQATVLRVERAPGQPALVAVRFAEALEVAPPATRRAA